MNLSARHRALQDRRTALPAEAYERNLTCQGCGTLVAVFEASLGARTEEDHRHLDVETYLCAACLDAE